METGGRFEGRDGGIGGCSPGRPIIASVLGPGGQWGDALVDGRSTGAAACIGAYRAMSFARRRSWNVWKTGAL